MAEKIVSPGVFTKENDMSFVQSGVGAIGAAVIGPTVKGPAMVPTQVFTYGEYQTLFGDSFKSGSDYYQYLTSMAAKDYLKHGGPLTVTRILAGGFDNASASAHMTLSGSLVGSSVTGTSNKGLPAVLTGFPGVPNSGSTSAGFTASFTMQTHADGVGMNSIPSATGSNNILTAGGTKFGTKDNLRWETSNINEGKGTFTLSIRRGDDTDKRKVILESFSNVSLDPQASNYLGKKVGTSFKAYHSGDKIIKSTGTYPNMSKYIYIDEASIANTVDYLDDNGTITVAGYTASLPCVADGTFAGGNDGTVIDERAMYQNIAVGNNQGIDCAVGSTGEAAYMNAIDLISNQDEYDVNLVFAPGIIHDIMPAISNKLITMCENRGDAMCIVDPIAFDNNVAAASAVAALLDSSYAAMYWPWVQVADPSTGKYVYVPQATVMPGIYAFNDKVSAEWFAPAGLNRGGQETVIQAEVKLTHAHRDTMYENNLNPVATFPGEGVVVWGQKTLQKKASALDRVNVRRLLINLKKFIASTSKYLVFENNTDATRNRFLSTVNPYMESVQSRQGLYAFKVVMDATNNTPDIIDQNILKGDIFLQPAKAAEFIVIDFNVMPTGATFND